MKNIVPGIIVGASLVVGLVIKGYMDRNSRLLSSVRVEGRAEEKIQADLFEWSFNYKFVGNNSEQVRERCKNAKKEIVLLLSESGLKRDVDYFISPKQLENGKTDNGQDIFVISQAYTVRTQMVDNATNFYKKTEHLADKGITINSLNSDMYKVKDKSAVEEILFKKALQNARQKADNCAKTVEGKLVGLPEISYSYVSISDLNSSESNMQTDGGSSQDKIARLELSAVYKMK